jgi:hypothetical protein
MTLETEYVALDAETIDRDAPPGRLRFRQARFGEFAREARAQAAVRRLLAGNGSGSDG